MPNICFLLTQHASNDSISYAAKGTENRCGFFFLKKGEKKRGGDLR